MSVPNCLCEPAENKQLSGVKETRKRVDSENKVLHATEAVRIAMFVRSCACSILKFWEPAQQGRCPNERTIDLFLRRNPVSTAASLNVEHSVKLRSESNLLPVGANFTGGSTRSATRACRGGSSNCTY